MDFVKRNLFVLVCAVVGLASLGGIGWGITRMSEVTSKMQSVAGIENNLKGLTRGAVGVDHVTGEYDRISKVADYYEAVLQHFTERTVYKPIMPDLLPDPTGSEEENKQLRYDFRPAYQAAMRGLLTTLGAGSSPGRDEIAHVEDFLNKKKIEAELTAGTSDNTETPPPARGRQGPPRGSGGDKASDLPERDGPASCKAYWDALAERAQDSAESIAAIQQARQIRCYANVDTTGQGSFDLTNVFLGGTHAPNMDEIWTSHLLYWPQKDLVDVLARINEQAAQALPAGETPWVANMPIKDILSIRISDYIVESDEDVGGGDGMTPARDQFALMTALAGGDLYDVINIRARLVIDVRDLPVLMDAVQHDRYMTVANVNYEKLNVNEKFTGKIYGPEPIVSLTVDLQTYMSYRNMVPMMPEVVREQLGTQDQFEELVGSEEEEEEEEGEG